MSHVKITTTNHPTTGKPDIETLDKFNEYANVSYELDQEIDYEQLDYIQNEISEFNRLNSTMRNQPYTTLIVLTGLPKKQTLKEMRQSRQMSIVKAASLAEVSYPSLRNWEQGKVEPSLLSIDRLLKLYDYSYNELDLEPFNKNN